MRRSENRSPLVIVPHGSAVRRVGVCRRSRSHARVDSARWTTRGGLYPRAGIPETWIADPAAAQLTIYALDETANPRAYRASPPDAEGFALWACPRSRAIMSQRRAGRYVGSSAERKATRKSSRSAE